MKDAAYSVAVNGNRTDRGPFHATQRWFSRASPNGIRAVANQPNRPLQARRRPQAFTTTLPLDGPTVFKFSRELLSGPFEYLFVLVRFHF
jgi:hypothetical protein